VLLQAAATWSVPRQPGALRASLERCAAAWSVPGPDTIILAL